MNHSANGTGAPEVPYGPDTRPPVNRRVYDADASVVLVGCRGAGKRTLGFIGALHLRRRLVTEDHAFEQTTGFSRAGYLKLYGKDAFARQNAEIFKKMLDKNRQGCVIVCGMTSLEMEAQRLLAEYSQTNPVIYVHREKAHMVRFLDQGDAEQLLQADQSHRNCSSFEYFNLFDSSSSCTASTGDNIPRWDALSASSSSLISAREDFTRFLDLLFQSKNWVHKFMDNPFDIDSLPPQFRQYSYALRLRLSFLLDMNLDWEDLEAAGDCVELIIDRWPDDLLNIVAKQVALIRRKLAYPIIYHVEENPRGRPRRPLEEKDKVDSELLRLGLRLNVDYISLDLQRSKAIVDEVLQNRGRAQIIGNFWNFGLGAVPWAHPSQVENFLSAKALGCDVVRMVRFCSGDSPHERLVEFRQKIDTVVPDPKPMLVAYDFSVLGARTPLQCNILNPVKHPDMGNEDHLSTVCSYDKSFELLFTQFLLDPLHFYTLGANVSYSISPAMHQTAYEHSRMPHTFQAVSCLTIEELHRIALGHSFGGASLTAPFKVAMMPHLGFKSKHAGIIGAVNVLLPLRGKQGNLIAHARARNKAGPPVGTFFGDNTDWSAILTCLKRAISPRNHVRPSKTTALVIGAGGMARAAIYALTQLGCRHIFIFNRTVDNAIAVATHFNDIARTKPIGGGMQICHVLPDISYPWPTSHEPPTIVISCVPATSVDGRPPADFEMPQQWLGSTTGGVVVELAYEPLVTHLVAQMQAYKDRDTRSPSWVIVDGLEVVSEMAIEAFELMTGRMAPKRLMKNVCRRTWEQHQRELSSMS